MESVLLRGVVHAADDLGEELSVQIGEKNAEGLGTAGNETARAAVRDVTHSAGDFANEPSRLVAHRSTAVQNSGHGGNGDPGFAGNILDRDHSPRIGMSCRLTER